MLSLDREKRRQIGPLRASEIIRFLSTLEISKREEVNYDGLETDTNPLSSFLGFGNRVPLRLLYVYSKVSL